MSFPTASDFFNAFNVMAQEKCLIVSLPRQKIKDLYLIYPYRADAWTFPSQNIITTQHGDFTIPENIIFPVTSSFNYNIFLTDANNEIEVTPLVLHNVLRDQFTSAEFRNVLLVLTSDGLQKLEYPTKCANNDQ